MRWHAICKDKAFQSWIRGDLECRRGKYWSEWRTFSCSLSSKHTMRDKKFTGKAFLPLSLHHPSLIFPFLSRSLLDIDALKFSFLVESFNQLPKQSGFGSARKLNNWLGCKVHCMFKVFEVFRDTNLRWLTMAASAERSKNATAH